MGNSNTKRLVLLSVDPRPLDKNVPANFLQNLVFNKFMYTKQDFYEGQLEKLGLLAYEVALLRGADIDRPRNLAKSVTVE